MLWVNYKFQGLFAFAKISYFIVNRLLEYRTFVIELDKKTYDVEIQISFKAHVRHAPRE